jgi:hypothetical protein
MFLLGTRLDFKADRVQASFTFQNPNQTGACGCGESISITPASEAQEETVQLGHDRSCLVAGAGRMEIGTWRMNECFA